MVNIDESKFEVLITERDDLQDLYNVVDWIDIGLIVAIVFYYGRKMSDLQSELPEEAAFHFGLMFENPSIISIALLMASLMITSVFIMLTIKQRKKRFIGPIRAMGRMIWNCIWIVLDVGFLLDDIDELDILRQNKTTIHHA